ncbi:hypothetical protein [Streptomyces bohaiensis]
MSAAEPTPEPIDEPTSGPIDEPLWMLRLNPLRRERLADPDLLDALTAVDRAEAEVLDRAARCADALYTRIGATEDRDVRGRLIALRRAIHNDTEPRAALLADDDPEVAAWQRARQRRAEARDRVAALHPGAAADERRRLARLLGDEDLRYAMTLVAPDAARGAQRYAAAVAEAPEKLTARLRKSERGLVQYVTRAMVRTSPMARFTAVGLAVPVADGPPPDAPEYGTPVPRTGLDRVMLDHVLGGVHSAEAAFGPDILVQHPPTSERGPDGKLYFLRATDRGDAQRLSVDTKGPVGLLLDATAMGPRRFADVVADFQARAGCTTGQAEAAVGGAVRAGFLTTRVLPEDGGADLAELLDAPQGPRSGPAADLLREIAATVPGLHAVPAEERPASLERLRRSLAELSIAARRPSQIVVGEDTALPSVRVATAKWRPQLDDLSAGVALLSAFDLMHDVRALLVAGFVDRFGAGADVSLTEHADALVQEMYRRGLSIGEGVLPGSLGPADGSLDRLYTLREQVADAVHADLTRAAERGEDVVWTAERATELVAGLPDRFRRDPLSYGVLVQATDGRLVFNNAYAGHGMLHGRFLAADRTLGGGALPHLARRVTEQYAYDGARVVEDLGLHRLNVNAHPPVLAEGLRPDDWYALRLVHDPETDSLGIRDAEGRPLRVLTLGTGHPEMYPPPLRLANWLTAAGELRENLVGRWHDAAGWDGRATRACPRFSVGSALLSRRRWYGGEELDAAVAAGPADHDRLLALAHWRARHGVPHEVVMKSADDGYPRSADAMREVAAGDAAGRPPGEEDRSGTNRGKPQYVDLASALSVGVLPRMRNRQDAGYLEEALPGVTAGPHAMEWVVEIGRGPGGPFQYGGKA